MNACGHGRPSPKTPPELFSVATQADKPVQCEKSSMQFKCFVSADHASLFYTKACGSLCSGSVFVVESCLSALWKMLLRRRLGRTLLFCPILFVVFLVLGAWRSILFALGACFTAARSEEADSDRRSVFRLSISLVLLDLYEYFACVLLTKASP